MSEAQGRTPLEDATDDREDAVRAWAAEYVQDARVELITDEFADIEQAKRDLRAALHVLETEIE
ncbi:hypothetical protein [Halohasta salina]|uniref:hypothetical protein n=1 Tax=Halohasta salina TaxID=2961621 RepID=UPI0020A343AB|nr:hypothetical protein [Halohasta salina]